MKILETLATVVTDAVVTLGFLTANWVVVRPFLHSLFLQLPAVLAHAVTLQ